MKNVSWVLDFSFRSDRTLSRSAALLSVFFLVGVTGCKKQEASDKDAAESGAESSEKSATNEAGAANKPGQPEAPADVAAAPKDAKTHAEGIQYIVLTEPPADKKTDIVQANDQVSMNFDLWDRKGKLLQSTRRRGKPITYPLGSIRMRDVAMATTGMASGEKRRYWVDAEHAYKPSEAQPPMALTYEIEVVERKAAPKTPENLAGSGSQKAKDGVTYNVVAKGKGEAKAKAKANPWDTVDVVLDEWDVKGRLYRSAAFRDGKSIRMPISQATPGLLSVLTEMKEGERRQVWVPSAVAYNGAMGRPEGDLFYDITLEKIISMPAPPPVPKDVAKAPASAKETEKGVSYKVLKKGKGKVKPVATDDVKVHYSGWTTDGKMFDSSVTRGEPITFNLGGVIPGWTDGLQTMTEGGKTRFWIPGKLAYEGRQRGPQGTLVFDVELIEIVKK